MCVGGTVDGQEARGPPRSPEVLHLSHPDRARQSLQDEREHMVKRYLLLVPGTVSVFVQSLDGRGVGGRGLVLPCTREEEGHQNTGGR